MEIRRDACLARHADAPARYLGLVRAFCSEHAHLGGVGAVLAVAEDGALRYTATTGQRCAGGEPVTADTAFRIGSLTKLLTAALALELLDLDAPLPELADHPDPRARAITVRQLLTHTSGLPDLAPSDIPTTPWRTALRDRPLWTAPGTLWSYSNAGYALVGAAIEGITGPTYADVLRERLTDPLHLRHITADVDRALADHAACGHLGRAPHTLSLDVRQDLDLGARGATWTIPAGGVIASAPDIVALVLALTDPTTSPLSAAARTVLLGADIPTHERPHERQAPGPRAEPLTDGGTLYRLGGHTGDFTADLSFAPDRGFVFVVLTNTGDPLRATVAAAHHDLLGHRIRPPAAPATASHYAGRYESPGRGALQISETLELSAPAFGLDAAPLQPIGDHRFTTTTTPALTVTFVFTTHAEHATHLRTRRFVATHVAAPEPP